MRNMEESKRMPLLYLETLGCPKNQADSHQIRGMLTASGYGFAPTPRDAEVILVNTCGFIDDAKEESIRTILRLSRRKKRGRCRMLVVIGCLVQKYGAELEASLPEVDLFLGVQDWKDLPRHIASAMAPAQGGTDRTQRLYVSPPEGDHYRSDWLPDEEESPAGYVKIADGCDHRCTFCVIPQIRGRYRSRRSDAIIEEVSRRVARGLREAVLVAQDTGAYGRDLAPAASLAGLIGSLASIEGLERIRIMYCYPEEVDDGLIEAMRNPKVCSYIDMPIQHVDDTLLRRMGRPTDSRRIREVIGKLRQHIPGLAIRTTLMVGFPGESEEAFQSLLAFLEEYRLERVGFFAFSPQPGTPAEGMPDQVSAEEKERRLVIAQETRDRLMALCYSAQVGQTQRVLIDEETGSGSGGYFYEGRSCLDAPEIDGLVSFRCTDRLSPGQFVNVRITHSRDYLLSGEINHDPCQ